MNNKLYDKIEEFQKSLIEYACGKKADYDSDPNNNANYTDTSIELLKNSIVKDVLPNFLKTNSTISQF